MIRFRGEVPDDIPTTVDGCEAMIVRALAVLRPIEDGEKERPPAHVYHRWQNKYERVVSRLDYLVAQERNREAEQMSLEAVS